MQSHLHQHALVSCVKQRGSCSCLHVVCCRVHVVVRMCGIRREPLHSCTPDPPMQVQNVVEMPHNDELTLLEASR
jgi:hypothetical protein